MTRVNRKDVALVAFATGLLAFEAVALQETVPAMKQSFSRLMGTSPARIASHLLSPAGTAGASVLQGASQVAEAAVGAAQTTVQAASRPAIQARKRAAAPPSSEARARTETRCVVTVTGGDPAVKQAFQVVASDPQVCRARARAIVVRQNDAIHRAITERRHDRAIHRSVEIDVDTDIQTDAQAEVSVGGEASSR